MLKLHPQLLKTTLPTALFAILLLLFIASSGFIARRLKTGILPDETHHWEVSKLYAATWGIPEDTPETYRFSYLSHRPFLYYWINGRAINALGLVFPDPSDYKVLVTLRFVSLFYASLSVVFTYLLAREVTRSGWWSLLAAFMLTSTVMFAFLAGGVNYDNLINMFSAASLFFLARALNQKPFLPNSLAWLACILAAALSKYTAIPLAAITGLVWLVYLIRNRTTISVWDELSPDGSQAAPKWHGLFARLKWPTLTLAALCGLLLVFNLAIYGLNLVRYQSLVPACSQILTEEQCQENAVIRRELRTTLPDPVSIADFIAGAYPDPFSWFADVWLPNIIRGVFGVHGHRSYFPFLAGSLQSLSLLWIGLLGVRTIPKFSPVILGLAACVILYILALAGINFQAELKTGFLHLGIQGRYIFPVISGIYALAVVFISAAPQQTTRRAVTATILLSFFLGSPYFVPFTYVQALLPEDAIQNQHTLGELSGEMVVAQTFTPACPGKIDQVELLLATYSRVNTQPVNIRLIDSAQDKVIFERDIPGTMIRDNAWLPIKIPPLTVNGETEFRLQITSPDSAPGNAITVWASQPDFYPAGQAWINGEAQNFDLSFRYRCLQPPFWGWFYD